MRRLRGFSLIEIVVVLALTSAILYTVALLTQRTVKTLNFLQRKSESIQSATLGCERLCSEMREAVTRPSTGGSSSWRKVIPSAPIAIDIIPPEPPPPPPATPPVPLSPTWPRSYPGGDLLTVSEVHRELGAPDVALVHDDRAVEIARRADAHLLAAALVSRAASLRALGRCDESETALAGVRAALLR